MNLPDKNLMSFTAGDLKDTPELGFLRGEVRRHIKSIEVEIREAVKNKLCIVHHEVEQNFAVTQISNKTAQRFVYAAIIDQLTLNGFKHRLILNQKKTQFDITWVNETDINEVARQQRLIDAARTAPPT